jgi:GNAT superfamily N-acetyltransferase
MAENPYLSLIPTDAEPPPASSELTTQQTDANPYLALIDNKPASPQRLSMMQVAGNNPDVEARLQSLAKQYGVPAEAVRLQQPDYERRAVIDSIDYDKLEREAPAVAGLLARPEKAGVSYDDTDNLSAIERAVRFLGGSLSAIGSAVPAVTSGFYGAVQAAAEGAAALTQPAQRASLAEGPVALAARLLPENPFERLAQGVARWRQQQDAIAKDMVPRGGGPISSGYYAGLQSAGQTAAALLTRDPRNVLGLLSGVQGGASYGQARDRGVAPGQAAAYGASQAAIEYATEMIPVSRFLTDFKAGTPFASMLARQIAAEIPGEQVATMLQDLNEWAVLNPEKPFSAYLAERPGAAAQTLVATIVSAGALTGAARGVQAVADRMQARGQAAEKAQADASALAEIDQMAAASKLRARDPDTFNEFVRQAASEGPVADVYIDVQSLAQSGVDVNALAQVSPSVAEQLGDAVATGGQIRIPVDEYTATIAGTEYSQSLLPLLKTDPLGLNQQEAQEFMQSRADQFRQEVERALTAQEPDNAFKASRDAVQQRIADELAAVNRFTPAVNQSYASLMANFYAVQAARLGVTPEEMAARYPIRFAAEDVAGGERLNQQIAPEAHDAFVASVERDFPGVKLDLLNGRKALNLSRIVVPEDARSAGIGTQIMRRIVEYADRNGRVLTLTPSADFGGNVPRLREFYKRFGFVENKGRDKDYEVSEAMYRPTQSLAQGERGSLTVPADITQTPPVLTLLQNADLSTFLHESGHFYLEVLTDIAARPDAPAEIQQDMQAVLDWFGVPDLTSWRAMTLDEKREHHEQFARGFEAYLFEGKAPSQELRGLFQKFRAWLVNVYRSLTALNVQLTDEVRQVFDRMLATSDAIADQQAVEGAQPLFDSAEAAGMTPEQWHAYQETGAEAQQDALQDLETRSLRNMKWLSNAKSRVLRDLQKQADAQRAAVRAEVEAEVYATPLYSAQQFLRRGTTTLNGEEISQPVHRLSIDALTEMYGGEGDKFALLDWSKLGYGKYGMLGKEGLHPDTVAQMFGFTSGDQLVHALLDAEPVESVIEGMTDTRMLERYGDLTDRAAMERAAERALHNEARTRFIAAELNALDQATGRRKVLTTAAKQFAENMINRLRVRDIKPGQYVAAEARAARESMRAFKAGDIEAAATEKRNQLVNSYATRAAYAAQEEVETAVNYLKKFDREGVRKSVDPSYLDQIDGLLERFDLRTGQTLRDIDRRKSLLEWVQAQQEQGLEPVIDPELLDEARRTSYKDLRLEELRGLVDAVKNIEHLGRLKKQLLTAKEKREFQAAVDEIAAGIVANAKREVPEQRTTDRGALVSVRRLFRAFKAMHRKFASYAREFDGWKDGGPAWEYLVRNMNDAGNFEAVENEKATLKLGELLAPILKAGKLSRKTYIPELNKSFTREEMLGVALNMGNSINRERVLTGENWTQVQLAAILNKLTKADWEFVQGVWDYLESFRPQIAAKERRLTGVEPQWVEPESFTVTVPGANGPEQIELKGGYYPIKYDPLRSSRAEADVEAEVQRQMERGLYARAQTRRGHLKARAETVGRPIRYDLDVIAEHVQQVVHDLAWHEYLVDANRLLRAAAIDEAIRDHYGPEVVREMRNTLTDIAIGNQAAQTALDRIFNHLRTGATVAGLGYRFTTSLLQPLGLTQSAVRIGPKWVLKGASHWAAGVVGLESGMKDIYDKSDFMRLRAKTMQREINEIRNRVSGEPAWKQKLNASYFLLIQKAQLIADVPTWWGAYEKAMAESDMTEARAIALADQAVIDAQGSGQIKDLAAIQRGGTGLKLFTSFYSFFNTTYNLTAEAVGRTDFKNPRQVGLLAVDLALLYMIPALMGTLMKAALHDDWDDEEKVWAAIVADQLNYLAGTMVGLRELGGAIQAVTGAGSGDYTGPASVRFFSDVAKLGKQIEQGEPDEAFWKALNSVGGVLFHYPAGQINATIQGLNALADGKTENPGAILVGAPPK